MLFFVILLLLIILLFGVFIFTPTRFGVRYQRTATRNKLHVFVSVFGILIRIPIHTMEEKHARKEAKSAKAKTTSHLSHETFCQRVQVFKELYETAKEELTDMLAYVRKHLLCKEIDFNIRFGLDDAAKTGISTGILWTSGTLLLKIIDSLIGIKKINMNVYPDFNEKKFEIYLKTILIMQPFRFIIIVRKLKRTIKFIQSNMR